MNMELWDDDDDLDALGIILYGIPRRIYVRGNYFHDLDELNFFQRFRLTKNTVLNLLERIENVLEYETDRWVLGDFLCKMYQFVHSLSYTASIFILVVICTERYFAIIHPITCKQILTPTRLRLVIAAVWITSAVYSAPRFIWVQTIDNKMPNGETETICATHRQKYNSKIFDLINFVLLYVIPLLVMTVLYTRIAVGLWRSSRVLEKHLNASMSSPTQPSPCEHAQFTCVYQSQPQEIKIQQLHRNDSVRSNKNSVNVKFAMECNKTTTATPTMRSLQNPMNSSQNILRARRGVIRMLIVVVLTFALCNLPFHARKMWQYWSTGYRGSSDFSTLFTPLTFLITYFNSGVNPLLYAFLSRNFRRGMREILLCSFRSSSRRNNQGQKLYNLASNRDHEERALGLFKRHASTRSTIKANTTTVTIINIVNSDVEECSQEV